MRFIKSCFVVACMLVSLIAGVGESVFAQEVPTYRFYRCDQIGDGTRSNPFRSVLTAYVTQNESGEGFWDLINRAVPTRYAVARTLHSVHLSIDGDVRCTALSSELADITAVNGWLDGTHDGVGNSVFEGDSISMAWTTQSTTRRQVFRYLVRQHAVIQNIRGVRENLALLVLAGNLDARVNTFPSGQRQAVARWMNSKGLSTTWITGSTTVRQVLQFILENADWPVLSLGEVSF